MKNTEQNKMIKWWLYLPLTAVIIANLLGNFFENTLLTNFSKPLILPLIACCFWIKYHAQKGKHFRLMLIAMFFSCLGDIFLMKKETTFFILGLASFLCSHIMYIFAFLSYGGALSLKNVRKYYIWLVVGLGYAVYLYTLLLPNLDSVLVVAVPIYELAILSMAFVAITRQKNVPKKSFQYTLYGAILFLISDSVLAYNKFGEEIPFSGFLIMATYIFAQFLIMEGNVLEAKKIEVNEKEMELIA